MLLREGEVCGIYKVVVVLNFLWAKTLPEEKLHTIITEHCTKQLSGKAAGFFTRNPSANQTKGQYYYK